MANSLKYQGFDNINEGQLSKQSKKSVPKVDPRSNGDPAGIRTPDPLLKRQLLCRLSYRIMSLFKCKTPAALIGLAGTAGLEPADEGVKVPCLPLGDAPLWKERGDRGSPDPLLCLGWVMGLEPTTPGTTIQCSAN